MSDAMLPRTAANLGVEFRTLEPVEQVSVRRHGAYLGKLMRTNPGGPVWADAQLQQHIGGSLSFDGPMDGARAAMLTMLVQEDEKR